MESWKPDGFAYAAKDMNTVTSIGKDGVETVFMPLPWYLYRNWQEIQEA